MKQLTGNVRPCYTEQTSDGKKILKLASIKEQFPRKEVEKIIEGMQQDYLIVYKQGKVWIE